MPELKIKDYKPSTEGNFQFADVKKGRDRYGQIRKYPNGLTIYWAIREPGEVFSKLDAWAIDIETLNAMRIRKVPLIGVLVTNGDRYVTRIEDFEDKDKAVVVLDYSNHKGEAPGAKGRFGALQRYLPRAAFAQKLAPPKGTLALMRIKGP